MNRVDRIALAGLVVMLASIMATVVLQAAVTGYALTAPENPPAMLMIWIKGLMLTRGMVTLLIHITIAAWLHRMASRSSERPWIWGVFGFLFGLVAATLFCFVRVALTPPAMREARP